ncbi:MAG: FG-GAP repeat domain-containing protein [Limisphaerales bacterium]
MAKTHPSLVFSVLLLAGLSAGAADATTHTFKKIVLTDQFWSEGANYGDFDHDGVMDIVSGPFWYEGPDFKQRHEYRPATATFVRQKGDGTTETVPGFEGALGVKNNYSDDFLTFVHDFNNDGWPDILVIGFPGDAVFWYENPKGAPGPWVKHQLLDNVDNESPALLDINGDGKPDLICNSHGYFGYATADGNDPAKPWTFHPVTPKGDWGKFTHGIGIGDVNGDGRMDLLEKDGWWEQPASLANDPVWVFHAFPFAPGGAAQMFAYDVNGDGLNDVITCLNPHGYGIVWWEQKRENGAITFQQHLIVGQDAASSPHGIHFSQPHSMALADMDGDGLLDIVTGKRFWAHGRDGPDPESQGSPALLYWFQLVRQKDGQVDFVPHLIDDDSGVGTQVVVGKISNSKYPDVVVGNKKGTFLFKHEVKAADPLVPLKTKLPAPAFIGTPKNLSPDLDLEPAMQQPPPPLLIPGDARNMAPAAKISSSDKRVGAGDLAKVTDGDKEATDEGVALLRKGLQYLQFDFGSPKEIFAVIIWHAHDTPKVFRSVIVQAAADADFTSNVFTLFNNDRSNSAGLGVGSNRQYVESFRGKTIDAKGVKARYLRFYSAGSTESAMNEYTEVEVYGRAVN